MLKKKLLGLIIGSGVIGGGVATYLYLNKAEKVTETTKANLDPIIRNREWAKNKFHKNWKPQYENLDFSLDLSK